jgi:Domain of unknown function (DUF4149)
VQTAQRVFRILWVLWAGSLWSMLWVASIMFRFESDRHVAGLIAASLFSVETYLGLALGLLALSLPIRSRFRLGFAAIALLLFNEWVLKAVMEAARTHGSALGLGFAPWHGISAVLYLIACLSVAVLVWQQDFR